LTNKKILLTISYEVRSLTRERLKIRPEGGENVGGRYESLLRKRGLKNNFSFEETW
jgi:hypothetical protein